MRSFYDFDDIMRLFNLLNGLFYLSLLKSAIIGLMIESMIKVLLTPLAILSREKESESECMNERERGEGEKGRDCELY